MVAAAAVLVTTQLYYAWVVGLLVERREAVVTKRTGNIAMHIASGGQSPHR